MNFHVQFEPKFFYGLVRSSRSEGYETRCTVGHLSVIEMDGSGGVKEGCGGDERCDVGDIRSQKI